MRAQPLNWLDAAFVLWSMAVAALVGAAFALFYLLIERLWRRRKGGS
jgi:hypothetical protein